MDEKAQASLESLLLVGGAVLVAVVVISSVLGVGNVSKQSVSDNANTYSSFFDNYNPFG